MSTKREGVPEFYKADLDEPVFVLRAQDQLAPMIVGIYALHAVKICNSGKVESVRKCAEEMRQWQKLHGAKIPD